MTSPVINKKQITMSFSEAMDQVAKGQRVTRIEWGNNDEYGLLKDGWLQIHTKEQFFQWMVSDGDMLATDWIVLKEDLIQKAQG